MTTKNQSEESDNNRIYEAGFLISPDISEGKLGEEVSKIKAILDKNGAFIISDEFPKLRQLTYVMLKRLGGKNLKISGAYFGWVKFELSRETIGKIKTELDALDSVIRFLLVKTVRENIMIQARAAYTRRPEAAPKKEVLKADSPKDGAHTTGMTDAELEKTIEELVVE